MSKIKASPIWSTGWADPRSLAGAWGAGSWVEITEYRYEMRYRFIPLGYEVVKRNLVSNKVEEVVASGLKRDAAEGFIKILGESE